MFSHQKQKRPNWNEKRTLLIRTEKLPNLKSLNRIRHIHLNPNTAFPGFKQEMEFCPFWEMDWAPSLTKHHYIQNSWDPFLKSPRSTKLNKKEKKCIGLTKGKHIGHSWDRSISEIHPALSCFLNHHILKLYRFVPKFFSLVKEYVKNSSSVEHYL